jgi:hypothetical protein
LLAAVAVVTTTPVVVVGVECCLALLLDPQLQTMQLQSEAEEQAHHLAANQVLMVLILHYLDLLLLAAVGAWAVTPVFLDQEAQWLDQEDQEEANHGQ